MFAAMAIALAVSGCNDTPEEVQRTARDMETRARALGFEDNLPDGCKLSVPGKAAGHYVVLVICDGRPSSSTRRTWTEQQGKNNNVTRHSYVVHIGPRG